MDDRMNDVIDEVQKRLGEEYEIVDSAAEADGILVRSASMHEMEFSS